MIRNLGIKIKPCKKNIGAELICNLNNITKNQINQEKTLGGLVKLVKSKIN